MSDYFVGREMPKPTTCTKSGAQITSHQPLVHATLAEHGAPACAGHELGTCVSEITFADPQVKVHLRNLAGTIDVVCNANVQGAATRTLVIQDVCPLTSTALDLASLAVEIIGWAPRTRLIRVRGSSGDERSYRGRVVSTTEIRIFKEWLSQVVPFMAQVAMSMPVGRFNLALPD